MFHANGTVKTSGDESMLRTLSPGSRAQGVADEGKCLKKRPRGAVFLPTDLKSRVRVA
jgi:hypothetical protein